MNVTSTRAVIVEAGGTQVVGHVGLHALGAFADRVGVTESLSVAVGWDGPGIPVHDRGRVLSQAMLMLAGGGESCADIEALASQGRLFGDVCSDTTLYRTFTRTLDEAALVRARRAMAQVRTQVWRRTSATDGDGPVILDIDASLVEIHSENKEGAAAHFKGGYGFHPVFCFADGTGDVLAGHLRAATPQPTTLQTCWLLSTTVWISSPPMLRPVIGLVTTPAWSNARWWCVQIRREAPRCSSKDYGDATSGSPLLPVDRQPCRQRS